MACPCGQSPQGRRATGYVRNALTLASARGTPKNKINNPKHLGLGNKMELLNVLHKSYTLKP
ncbi:MAG: hypothetical protein NZ519_06215 [Bacteroidia bacterium]|nr:hypothetical protein [Bacteroidia bacterium]